MKPATTVVLVGGGNIVSGREIIMLQLARGLRGAEYRPVFITSLWGGRDQFVSRLNAYGLDYYRVRLGFISKSLSWKPMVWTVVQLVHWPSLFLGYLKAIKAIKPQVVIHTNWHHTLLLMPLLDRHRDLYWSHEIILNRPHYGWVFRAIAKRVARVVCVSQAAAESMERLAVPASKLTVIHNGALLDGAIPPPRTNIPLRLGLVGQISPFKGHDDALEALAQLPRGTAVLKIFGTGQHDHIEMLKLKAKTLGISELIEWRGFLDNQAEIYGEIDVCLIPSRFADPFPTVALESGLAGRSVICTSTGGLSEIVNDQVTGFRVPPNQPDLLTDAIKTFVNRPELVVTMGRAAKERIANKFSSSRFIRQFIHLIDQIKASENK